MNIKDEIPQLLDDYSNWVKDKTILKSLGDKWVEITTPHLDRHNDCLQIYAKKDDQGYLLTDDGYTISDLYMSGCSLDSPKRKKMLKTILAGFGVQLEGEELFIRASANDFPLKKHSLVQAMLAVNDLFYLASSHVVGVFFEDVSKWMDLSGIRYTPNVKFAGKSGFDHLFDFVIPKSNVQPERIVQTINNPQKNTVEALVFKWMDTRETRSSGSKMFAFLNNSQTSVSEAITDALHRYEIQPILWTQNEKVKEILVA